MFSAAEFEEFLLAFPTEVTFCGAGGAVSHDVASRADAERVAQLYLFATGQAPLKRSNAGSARHFTSPAHLMTPVTQSAVPETASELRGAASAAVLAFSRDLQFNGAGKHSAGISALTGATGASSGARKNRAAGRRAQVASAAAPRAPAATLTVVESAPVSEQCSATSAGAPALSRELKGAKMHLTGIAGPTGATGASSGTRKKRAAGRRAKATSAASPLAPTATMTAAELDDPAFLSTMLQDVTDIKAMLAFDESLKPAEIALLAREPEVLAALMRLDRSVAQPIQSLGAPLMSMGCAASNTTAAVSSGTVSKSYTTGSEPAAALAALLSQVSHSNDATSDPFESLGRPEDGVLAASLYATKYANM